jgi:hypothetical protein
LNSRKPLKKAIVKKQNRQTIINITTYWITPTKASNIIYFIALFQPSL